MLAVSGRDGEGQELQYFQYKWTSDEICKSWEIDEF